jgi:Trypsin
MKVLIVVLAAICAGMAAGLPPVSAGAEQEISSIVLERDASQMAKWNFDRLGQANAMPLPRLDEKTIKDFLRQHKPELKAPASPSGTPAAQFVPGSDMPVRMGRMRPFSGNIHVTPLVFAGRLFLSSPQGDMVCSAQFISPNIVLTAAHCVQDNKTGLYYRNFAFALQYENGKYANMFSARCAATLTTWLDPPPANYLYDYAMLLVEGQSTFGYFGTYYNWSGVNTATKIGYPIAVQHGEIIQVDSGQVWLDSGMVGMRHGNLADQRGSSGGAWILGLSDTLSDGANRVISVTSLETVNQPELIYGPYFTDAFRSLYDYTARGCK